MQAHVLNCRRKKNKNFPTHQESKKNKQSSYGEQKSTGTAVGEALQETQDLAAEKSKLKFTYKTKIDQTKNEERERERERNEW